MANVLKKNKQDAVISLLLEGNSVRSTERLTGVHRDTIGVPKEKEVEKACEPPAESRNFGVGKKIATNGCARTGSEYQRHQRVRCARRSLGADADFIV